MSARSLIFLLLIAISAAAQSPEDISKSLANRFKGQSLTSKKLFEGGAVHFDSSGEIVGKFDKCESWTLCRTFLVNDAKLKDNQLVLETQRVAIRYDNGQQTPYKIEDRFCTIKIDLPKADEASAIAAMLKVFLNRTDNPAVNLPAAWAKYFDPPPPVPVKEQDPGARKPGVIPFVTAAKPLKQVQPHYPEIAKKYRQEGTVVLGGIIGKDGRLHDLWLVKPVGFGLDEAAIEAVQKWEYQPTTLNGEPVDVDTTINVNFTLQKRR